MTINNQTKINQMLKGTPPGVVLLSSWLKTKGYSYSLQAHYKKSNWLSPIGMGAYVRTGTKVDYFGGLYALQAQAGLSVHLGGRTALSLLGRGHYLNLANGSIVLFGGTKEKLPTWFFKNNWGVQIDYFSTSFLPRDLGLIEVERPNFTIKVSSAARAMLECLYLAPLHQEFFECYELMEGMSNLRPKSVQELLENCTSVKAKRMFLYLAEKFKHEWLQFIDMSKIDLGSGKRRLVLNGIYIDKYKITVPREFEKNDRPEI